jgi:hypothetical protein
LDEHFRTFALSHFRTFALLAIFASLFFARHPLVAGDDGAKLKATEENFVRLPDQQITLLDNQDAYSIKLGLLRASRQYEFSVIVLNSRTREFKPTKGKVSCNCLVGSFDDKSIAQGQTGRIDIRIRTRPAGGEYAQVAIVESSAGDSVMLNIHGLAVHGLEFVNLGAKVASLKKGELVEAVLEPQFSDVYLPSVTLEPQTGTLSIVSSEIDGGKIRLKLLVLRTPSTSLLQETFKLTFKTTNSEKSIAENLDFSVRSEEVTIRPSIVRLMHEDGSSENAIYMGNFWIINPPDSLTKVEDGKFEFLLEATEDVLSTETSLAMEKTGLKCDFRVMIPKAILEKVRGDSWLRFIVRINGQEIGRLRCIFVHGK